MNARLWACIVAGVFVAHIALIFIIDHFRSIGRPQPKPVEPTFLTSTTTFTDAQGRKVKEVREFTVSTELADKATLEKLPPPPRETGEGL